MAGAVWQAVCGKMHSEPEDQQGLWQLGMSWRRTWQQQDSLSEACSHAKLLSTLFSGAA